MNLKEFGKYLTEERIRSGFKSQRQLCLKSGVSSATLSRIESGVQKPEPETLKSLSKHLKASLNEIMSKAGYYEYVEKGGLIEDKFKDAESLELELIIKETNEVMKEYSNIEQARAILNLAKSVFKEGKNKERP